MVTQTASTQPLRHYFCNEQGLTYVWMLLEAVVSYGEHFALYHLSSEQESVYQAELIKFYGSAEAAPPQQVLLVKGVRKWIGHPNIPQLLDDLGQAIDSSLPQSTKASQRAGSEADSPDAF